MARTKISEFSATAADNTDIDNIDIAEGCAPSGINNAIRELMAQLKDFQTGAGGDSFNGAVNGTVGATTPAAGTFTNLAYTGTLTGGTGVVNIGSGQLVKDASGNLLVGTTTVGGDGFSVRPRQSTGATTFLQFNRASTTTSGNVLLFENGGVSVGSISHNNTATTYSTSSDYRLKENVAPMTGALAKVAQLNPVTYTWKADGSAGQGFIAHELQAVVPDAVVGEKDAVDADGNPKYQGVDTSFLVATLVAAIQELTAKVEALEAAAA